jgi:hypothetical protein
MKKILFLAFLVLPVALWAHTPLLVVEDNGDGTLYIEAGFSNGASAAGTDVLLKSLDGEVLWQGKMSEDYLEVEMPSVPYTVTLDAGPGHIVTKDGPEPAGGFGAAPAEETPAATAPVAAPAASADGAVWSPSITMGAVPPAAPTVIEIILVIIGALNAGILAYIALLLKRSRE